MQTYPNPSGNDVNGSDSPLIALALKSLAHLGIRLFDMGTTHRDLG
jgi:hypothetical protein